MPHRPKIVNVESVFEDRAVLICLRGRQTLAFATPVRKLLYWLSGKGKRHFVFDLRETTYPADQLGPIVDNVIQAARVLPSMHIALLHTGKEPETVRYLMQANRRIGNKVLDVHSLDEARNWMFPGMGETDGGAADTGADDYFDLDSLDRRSA